MSACHTKQLIENKQKAAKVTGLSVRNTQIVASVVTIVGVLLIMLAIFLLCRGPVKRSIEWCKECCSCGRDDDDEEEEDDDDDEEEGACANICSCCTKDSDYDFDDSDDEADKKKAAAKSMSAASARTKGNTIYPLLHFSIHFLLLPVSLPANAV